MRLKNQEEQPMQNTIVKQEKLLKLQNQNLRLYRLFRNCLLGYRWFFSTLGKAALFLISLLFIVSLVIIPLWYLSTTYPAFYGSLVVGILGFSILAPIFLRVLRTLKYTSKEELELQLKTRVRRTGFILLEVLLFLGAFRSYQEGNLAIAIGVSSVFLLALGLVFYRCHEKQ